MAKGAKGGNKRIGICLRKPTKIRYRTEQRWRTNAIKRIEKHLEKYDKKGNDRQTREALERKRNEWKS